MTRLLLALVLALLLAVATACADRSATQYAGSVRNTATPEADGSLRLTLFSRTDSSFSGVMELGAPERGTGVAYAWHEGSELRVTTVAAEGGDTIHWTSRLTGEELGGRFEITGGARTGQQGTWRARRVQGLPASPATLARPQLVPVPPLRALWPLALLALAIAAAARWVRASPRAPGPLPASPLAGAGGWLALFAMAEAIGLLRWIGELGDVDTEYAEGIAAGAAMTGMQPLIVLETGVQLLGFPLGVAGLVLIARRSPLAPRFWFATLVLTAAYVLMDVMATPLVHEQVRRLVGTVPATGNRGQQLGQVCVSLAWALYWTRSRRVRATFGAAALDREVMAPEAPLAPVPGTDPQHGRRWWGRVALRVAAGLVVAAVAIMGIAVWSSRVTPHEVPERADIRATVAGRWAWASDTTGCASAHTIAFVEDGKVMTITSTDSAGAERVATYDAEVLSRSTIRGAIRGETRRTDDGTPVVWDLVLTGPDEYRWRRTDWHDSPWNYTGRIERCPGRLPAAEPDAGASAPP